MQVLNPQETADYLESATIDFTHDTGFAIVHTGVTDAGHKFVLVNDYRGESVLTESM